MTICGHTRHVGTCPACQRVQLARWRFQLQEASAQADVSDARPPASDVKWNQANPNPRDLPRMLTTF
jgi:hypothetical protein